MVDSLNPNALSQYTGRATNNLGVVFDNSKQAVSVDDFLTLMVTQLQNQDFMNPVDDTQFVTQLAQFATMQSMQEMSGFMKTNYVLSLIGQQVTAARFTVSGAVEKETGPISKISLVDNEFAIYVNDKKFTLEQIMEYHSGESAAPAEPDSDDGDEA
jgi:flagellar basal-body rod modification protein FlgD